MRELILMRWGSRLPPPNSGRRRSPMCEIWNHSVGADGSKQDGAAPCQQHRFEWTDSRPKVTHWSALDQSRPLFAFAGIWRIWRAQGRELLGFLNGHTWLDGIGDDRKELASVDE